MRSRNALWVLLALGVAGAVAVLLITRDRPAVQAAPPVLSPAPVPAPLPAPSARAEPEEQPLPTWVRVAIVVGALLAFLAVSLIATKEA